MTRTMPSGAAVAVPLVIALLVAFATPAEAQAVALSLGQGGSYTNQLVQIVALVTVLSLAPGILVMVTSFTRIVIVLSFLRSALGLQQTPPNPVLIGLALFLTAFVMGPTFQKAYDAGLAPYMAEQIDEQTAFERASAPVRDFMLVHTRAKDLDLFLDLSDVAPASPEATPLRILVPAFMISELRRAFEIGFLIFIPFLVIDLLIASILMSMGMMMLPPVMISLPIKLIFFVLVDGWYLVAGSLVQSFQS
jgi:flagellar biosynthetic protein FliP